MGKFDDSTLAYLYGRYDFARRSMNDESLPSITRRDWAMRAEELRQCLCQLERWRSSAVGSRYQPEVVTAEEIHPPQQANRGSTDGAKPRMTMPPQAGARP